MKVAAGVQLICLDVDGVLTDGGIFYVGAPWPSEVALRFDTRDAHGHQLLAEARIAVSWVSGNDWRCVRARARKLGVATPLLRLGVSDKSVAVRAVAGLCEIDLAAVAYVGNDVNDLPAMELVGLPIAVADADWEVRARAAYVTVAKGGHGAAREVADLILAAKARP